MRKAVLIILLVLFIMSGCTPQAELGDLVRETYISPELTFGVMDAPKLEQDPNLNRLTVTSGCMIAETEAGFYLHNNLLLCYADKTNLDLWVPVCSTPKCKHKTSGTQFCKACLQGKRFLIEDDRIHYIDDVAKHQELTFTADHEFAVFSLAGNGSDLKLERMLEDTLFPNTGGGVQQIILFPDHMIYMEWELTTEGREERRILRIDDSRTQTLYEHMGSAEPTYGGGLAARDYLGLYGDDAFLSTMIDGGLMTLCWVDDGNLITADLSDLQTLGSYFSNNVLRYYAQNDGYYDRNLHTGETTKLAQPQLENGYAHIIQPNCILESTLLNASSTETRDGIEQHSLRLFDGTGWLDVSLPEELLNAPDSVYLYPMGIGTDAVYLRCLDKEAGEDLEILLCKIVLGTDSPALEYCGKITKFVPDE